MEVVRGEQERQQEYVRIFYSEEHTVPIAIIIVVFQVGMSTICSGWENQHNSTK